MFEWIAGVLFAVALLLVAPVAPVAPTPPAPPAPVAPAPASDVDAYVAEIRPALMRLGSGVGEMSALMGAPALESADWRASAKASFEDVRAGHAALQAYTAPAAFADAHASLVAATQQCADGADAAQAAVDRGEAAGLYAATALLVRCAGGIEAFGDMLDAMR